MQALISLFVFSTRDGWVEIMHNGIDAVGIDKQVQHLFYCLLKVHLKIQFDFEIELATTGE